MTDFNVGDTVRSRHSGNVGVLLDDPAPDFFPGHVWFRVTENGPQQYSGRIGREVHVAPTFLELVERAAPVANEHRVTFEPDITTDYDFVRGDARRLVREDALAHAVQRTYDRGCAQTVRKGCPVLLDGEPSWVIQDVR